MVESDFPSTLARNPLAILENEFAWRALAPANAMYFLDLWRAGERSPKLAALIQVLSKERLLGVPARIGEAWKAVHESCSGLDPAPVTEPVFHLFPVYLRTPYNIGMLVPLKISQASQWYVSDAFGTFKFSNNGKTPLQALHRLLKQIEDAWQDKHPGRIIPLRWRTALAVSIACPIHFDAIEGESLQLPLVVALLRGLAATTIVNNLPAEMPFGNGPLFATGELTGNTFRQVLNEKEKLQAFLREAGSDHPAILTSQQLRDLESTAETRDLLGMIKVHKADNLSELLALGPIREALERLSEAPHLTEIDSFLTQSNALVHDIEFDDAFRIGKWLLPHVRRSLPYRVQVARHLGMLLLHDGKAIEARKYLDPLKKTLVNPRSRLGVDERLSAGLGIATSCMTSGEPQQGLDWLALLAAYPEQASQDIRVAMEGSRCELLRASGRWNEAVAAGRAAVKLAQIGLASSACRDMNYLIHALLRRAAAGSGNARRKDLDEAESLLAESSGKWAPRNNMQKRASHLKFCGYMQAELARLRHRDFSPRETRWGGTWDHPVLFTLLACARNRSHSLDMRREFCACLVTQAKIARDAKKSRSETALYELFYRVYICYETVLAGKDPKDAIREVGAWCDKQREAGAFGWSKILDPLLKGPFAVSAEDWAEALCDAVYFH